MQRVGGGVQVLEAEPRWSYEPEYAAIAAESFGSTDGAIGVGAPKNVTVVRSDGPMFSEAATHAMRWFIFAPACSDGGRPMAVRILSRYRFRLP